MLLVDLDDFGTVNRRCGHLAGDRVLAAAAARIVRAAGPDALVGRLGGDEFGVLTSAEDAEGAARRIVAAFARERTSGEWIGASIGFAIVPADGRDWETIVAGADLALREVKGRGKGAVRRHSGVVVSEHSAGRQEIRDLWERDRIEMWVQPIVDAAAGAIHGYEALARFADGRPPDTWFARAEQVGLRTELELACLERALVLFERRPPGTHLSINLSAAVVCRPATRERLLGLGELHGLVIEITEEALLAHGELPESLEPLRAAGARVALDDVGTGQASLRHLAELQPAYIKLDRSVVAGVHRDAARAALVDAFVGYAERTGAAVVAEGVEEHEELECLLALNTPLVQGYLTGRPAPPWPASAARPTPARPRETAAVVDIDSAVTAEELRRRFEAQPQLAAAVVVGDDHGILGLVTRDRLLQAMGRQYGHALFAGRPALKLADRRCLVVPAGAPDQVLVRRAISRPLSTRHDPIVLRDADGRLAGAVTVTELLRTQLQTEAAV